MAMMTADDVQAFLKRMGWSDSEMERRTGVTRKTLAKYREEGAPLWFGLVCAALDAGLDPWRADQSAAPDVAAYRLDYDVAKYLMDRAKEGDTSIPIAGRRYRIEGFRMDALSQHVIVDVSRDG